MRAMLEATLVFAARLPRRTITGEDLRLNLGSSTVTAPGWLNFDLSPNAAISQLPRPVIALAYSASGSRLMMSRGEYIARVKRARYVFCDLTKGIPVEADSAAFVYSSHFIEHLSATAVLGVFRETLRVLRPGGLVRVTCPDLSYAAHQYVDGNRESLVRFVEGDHGFHGVRDAHRSFWDVAALRECLMDIGFTEIAECGHRRGATPDLELLETHSPIGCLFVEARKPIN